MLKKTLVYFMTFGISCISAMHDTEYQLSPQNFSTISIEKKEEKDSLLIDAILDNDTTNIERHLQHYKSTADVRILRFLTNITYRAQRNYVATLLFARIEQIVCNNRLISIIERDNLAKDVLSPNSSCFAQDIIAIDSILKNQDCETLHGLYQENFDIGCRIIKIALLLTNKLNPPSCQ